MSESQNRFSIGDEVYYLNRHNWTAQVVGEVEDVIHPHEYLDTRGLPVFDGKYRYVIGGRVFKEDDLGTYAYVVRIGYYVEEAK